ncbi:MAG: hypothetical protein ACOC2H_01535 [Spirochaetota bacterium]
MRQLSHNKNEVVGGASSKPNWKRRPSEIKGYQRALYTNDADGNYIRLDYNTKTKKVRIYYEPADEGGVSYYSSIEDGTILMEKNLASGRLTDLSGKFSALAPVILSIPNKEVLRIIGENYGLHNFRKEIRDKVRQQEIEKTRRRYFRQETKEKEPILGTFDKSKRLGLHDILDLAIGGGIGAILYVFLFNFQYLGMFLSVYGISLGLYDMFVREREPIFFKILLFVISGLAAYIYGYYIY